MKVGRRSWARVAAWSLVAALGVVTGCSAATAGAGVAGSTDEALAIRGCNAGQTLDCIPADELPEGHAPVCSACEGTITPITAAQGDAPHCDSSTDINMCLDSCNYSPLPIPSALQGRGCTTGMLIHGEPF